MSTLFEYYSGTLEEFLSLARNMDGNRLMKIQLTPSTLPEYQGYRHVLDNYTVKHILHRHSGKRERLRGQEPITLEDLLLISDIALHADEITPVQCKNGNPGYIYTKSTNDETFTLIEEVRKGHSELAVTTLYKRKKKLTDAKSPE